MARKVANGVNKRQTRKPRTSSLDAGTSFRNESNFETGRRALNSDRLRELIDNPTVRYVAAGIATAVLSRLATNLSEKYPELSRLLKENVDSFEGRIGQFRSGGMSEERESRI